jgi:hypothetical protein
METTTIIIMFSGIISFLSSIIIGGIAYFLKKFMEKG